MNRPPPVPPSPVIETFPALRVHGDWIVHGFIGRIPGVDVGTDRDTALARLAGAHARARDALGLGRCAFRTAEQVHGNRVARVGASGADKPAAPAPGADALVTDCAGVVLGIYVADCCPVYLVDPRTRTIALAHAGRRGTELGIVPATIAEMKAAFGVDPSDLIVQLGPCIRPPHYEIDFAAILRAQCAGTGVRHLHDCLACTASAPDRYYSYRRERGRTGRMLALLAKRVV